MLDSKLRALAGCPVIESDKSAMTFKPNPVITAYSDGTLAHEICHVLAGRRDFEIFVTAVAARGNSELFRHVLNMLYDWYHESIYRMYSGYLNNKINDLHASFNVRPVGIKAIDDLYEGYLSRKHIFEVLHSPYGDAIDLIVLADNIVKDVLEQTALGMIELLGALGIGRNGDKGGFGKLGAGGNDIDGMPPSSNYYISAVSRYNHIINELTKIWKKNKYAWINNYYGEINWRNLPAMFLGEKLSLPVWRLYQKVTMSRKIYLVIDRSGSTEDIKSIIMDTAVIIAESLRILEVPISILDVGSNSGVVNGIDESLDLSWFTPRAGNGTPLGEVCSLITKADNDSYLLIVTDGQPNDWDELKSALNAFPGSYLAFVIGDSYGDYQQEVGNAVHVEPHTIIREVIQNENLN